LVAVSIGASIFQTKITGAADERLFITPP